ncbi:UDP-N-acetylglucosamine diphosphorylase/glucosamine-1-phosphate N-acetyltransferase [Lutibacter agarilyticus]|uniref:UDP-N-acetylglucosamine diphosphorylase/glucosamine-1-phosphate N-acetyltransferase n=1 Tax=Lutibacter agarilyticus TaxID=1109740 RepID=A0A238YSD0_9FLAO|nr:GlmU family protein [Lutibacter agarilyticus]SNR73601.1 UDP-N-acetylglucosamine diphosphorylase/glucosamine-1-phosphate N-acetyltransferase [Lutibacter agarilyticus]
MNYILFDGTVRDSLLPLTYTRPVADLRIGILTIREKWETFLGYTTTTLTEEYLEEKYPMVEMEQNVMINASFLPTTQLVEIIQNLKENQAVFQNEEVIAFYTTEEQEDVDFETYEQIEFKAELLQIKNTWDLFSLNDKALKADFQLITDGRKSEPIPEGVQYLNKENIFIEEGAQVLFSVLNATEGPIYIGKDTLVMEGSLIRGPFAMCEHAVVKMGSKVYGATTLGPKCKIGGEVNNSILFASSSKGHEGYLGNSVLGEWCNLGADTNNSNLKNNYEQVRLWNYETENFAKTGLQFCGLIMGDHSKSAINTMFNTGTVVGVSSNIYGSNFPRNFVPSFSWGGAAGITTYQINKAKQTANLVMKRKNEEFDEVEQRILEHVFEITSKYRKS